MAGPWSSELYRLVLHFSGEKMESEVIIDIFQNMLYLTMISVGIITIPGLIAGFIISVFQAATQINESTLSFLPKLFVIMLIIALASPWLMHGLVEYTESLVMEIPYIIG